MVSGTRVERHRVSSHTENSWSQHQTLRTQWRTGVIFSPSDSTSEREREKDDETDGRTDSKRVPLNKRNNNNWY